MGCHGLSQRRLDAISAWMLRIERLAIELMLSACSGWAAWKFEVTPDILAEQSFQTHLLQDFSASRHFWAAYALVASLSKLIGIYDCRRTGGSTFGLILRCLGLSMSGVLWCVIGASYLEGPLTSVASVPLVLLGASAWWALVRYPFVLR
jgi:hypothetical protein